MSVVVDGVDMAETHLLLGAGVPCESERCQ